MKSIKVILSVMLAMFAGSMFAVAVGVPHIAPYIGVGLFTASFLLPSNILATTAGMFDPYAIPFNGKQIMDISETILQDVYSLPDINKFHTVVSSIKAKQQIGILGLLGLKGKLDTGCDPSTSSNTIPTIYKLWDPVLISSRDEECASSLIATFFVWAQNNGYKRADLTDTEWATFIAERELTQINEAIQRIAWFSDLSAAHWNASPAGVITNSISLGFVNAIDGLWAQIYDIVATTPAQRITITKNAASTYALQAFDSTDVTNKVVTNYLTQMLRTADLRLRDNPNAMFVVTQTVYDQYYDELVSTGAYIQAAWDMGQKQGDNSMSPPLYHKGVPVYAYSFWDRMINTLENSGTKWNKPHRALLTTKGNVQIGVDDATSMNKFDMFYDRKTKYNIVDWMVMMDAKLPQDILVMTAY